MIKYRACKFAYGDEIYRITGTGFLELETGIGGIESWSRIYISPDSWRFITVQDLFEDKRLEDLKNCYLAASEEIERPEHPVDIY
jgi:hypothetical protein